ncbi:carbohydrate ABC transporter permease, partial [Amylibacter sp.]|nr:carbohydrate ABC transporter permease [Amylibacter sp.]
MITKTLSHFVLGLIVFIWVVPFVALVSTSLRSETEAKTAGFWTAFTPTELGHRFSTHDKGEKIKIFTMNGNIFDRLNKDKDSFIVSGEINSILIKQRIADPEKPGKTKLVRKLVPAGELMDVRGGDFIFSKDGIFSWTFSEETLPKPKNLDVFINQNPIFGTDAYIEVLFDN